MENDSINNPEDIKKAVGSIENSVKSLEKQKLEIQTKCKHKDGTHIAFDESKSVRVVCDTCESIIGYANPEETKTFLGS